MKTFSKNMHWRREALHCKNEKAVTLNDKSVTQRGDEEGKTSRCQF